MLKHNWEKRGMFWHTGGGESRHSPKKNRIAFSEAVHEIVIYPLVSSTQGFVEGCRRGGGDWLTPTRGDVRIHGASTWGPG